MSADARLIALATAAFALAAIVGAYVAHRPPTPLDVAPLALRGEATPLAIIFTRSGYWQTLSAITLLLGALCTFVLRQPAFVVVLGTTQLLSQAAAQAFKSLFKRIRPDDWLFHQELGYSFPSGHATTAIVFYGGLLVFLWSIPIPRLLRLTATVVLAVWIAGISWSRVALRAHYATDVIGGMLFGLAWLCLMIVVLRHLPAFNVRI